MPVTDRHNRRADEDDRYRFAAISVSVIWIALTAASLWSPDLISDTDRTHVPIAGFLDWIYAVIATGLVMLAFGRRTPDIGRTSWASFATLISAIWALWRLRARGAIPDLGDRRHAGADRRVGGAGAGVLATAFASVFVAGSWGDGTSGVRR